jgi:hypothetical protein
MHCQRFWDMDCMAERETLQQLRTRAGLEGARQYVRLAEGVALCQAGLVSQFAGPVALGCG